MSMAQKCTGVERNGAVEFVRFLFSIIICILHYRDEAVFGDRPVAFYGGYLAVDFFFVLSGFLMMQHFSEAKIEGQNEDIENKWKQYRCYVAGRIKALYPVYIIGLAGVVMLRFLAQKWTLKMVFVDGFYEFFMLQETGIGQLYLDDHLWFVSALFLAQCILAYFLIFHRQFFLNFLAPILAVSIPAVMYRRFNSWATHCAWGTLRAIGMLSLGCLVCVLYLYVKGKRSALPKGAMSLAECAVLAVILYIMWGTRNDYRDFVVIPFWAILVLLLFLKRGYLSKVLDNRVSCYLGRISYAIYVCQHISIIIFAVKPLPLPETFSPLQAWAVRTMAFIGLTIMTAVIVEPLSRKLTKTLSTYFERISEVEMPPDSKGA